MKDFLTDLNAEQYEAVTTIYGPLLIIAGAGSGKSLLNGTGVLTESGYVPIETLKIGDFVFGRDGNLHQVLGVFPQGKKEVVEVTFSDGNIIRCCEDHLWNYQTAKQREKKRGWNTAPLKEIAKMDLAKKRGQFNRNNIYIPMCEPVQFKTNETPIPPYLMGALLGDGTLSGSSVFFSNSDKEVINRVNIELKKINHQLKQCSKYDYFVTMVNKGGTSLISIIKELDLYNCRSDEKFIPDVYKYNDVETRKNLLAGLIDTDGSVGRGYYKFCTVSKQLAKDVQFICESLGMTAKISTKKTTYTYKGEKRQGKMAYRLLIKTNHYIPQINYTKRKSLNLEKVHVYARRHIESIRYTGKYNDMTCIKIDSDDSLFLAEHCIVTHNTHTVVSRVANMIDEGIDPKSILLLTFTNKAAKEMKDRIISFIGVPGKEVTACTFHSFCANFLRRHAALIGIDNGYTILDGVDAVDAMSIAKQEFFAQQKAIGIEYDVKDFPKTKVICQLYSVSINNNSKLANIVEASGLSVYYSEIRSIVENYVSYKKEHNLFDYDDLLLYTKRILEKYPDVRKKLGERYQYVSADEYQDTNVIQDEILNLICEKHQNLAVVGDDNQSIYAFRCANIGNILTFDKRYKNCKSIVLKENYRSSQEVLDVANSIMNYATEGIEKRLHGQFHYNKPKLRVFENNFEESDFIVSEIQKYKRNGVPLRNIAVIVRSAAQTFNLEVKLNQLGIPYEKFGGIKFMEKNIVKNILSYLRVVVNESDELAIYRILQLYPGIGKTYAKKISNQVSTGGIQLLSSLYPKSKFNEYLKEIYDVTCDLKNKPLNEQLEFLIESYYEKVMLRNIEFMKASEATKMEETSKLYSQLEEVKALYQMAKNYKTASRFLSDVVLDATEPEDENDKLNITTIHSAKGLEYDIVFVMDLVEGITPKTKEGDQQDAEELRCLYVAVTRAKRELYLLVPKRHFNGIDKCILSHFINKDDVLENLDINISKSELASLQDEFDIWDIY